MTYSALPRDARQSSQYPLCIEVVSLEQVGNGVIKCLQELMLYCAPLPRFTGSIPTEPINDFITFVQRPNRSVHNVPADNRAMVNHSHEEAVGALG